MCAGDTHDFSITENEVNICSRCGMEEYENLTVVPIKLKQVKKRDDRDRFEGALDTHIGSFNFPAKFDPETIPVEQRKSATDISNWLNKNRELRKYTKYATSLYLHFNKIGNLSFYNQREVILDEMKRIDTAFRKLNPTRKRSLPFSLILNLAFHNLDITHDERGIALKNKMFVLPTPRNIEFYRKTIGTIQSS